MHGVVLVVGSANLDEVYRVPHIVKPGETVASTSFSRSTGGKGANTAIGAARAGASVRFCGSIGRDGDVIERALSRAGVDTEFLHVSEDLPTGRAVIQVADDGENSIVIQAGANFKLAVPLAPLHDVQLLLLQNEIPLDRTISALRQAHEAGVVVVFNPSPLPSIEHMELIPWELVDWLVVNRTEVASLGETICSRVGALVTTLGHAGARVQRQSHTVAQRPAGNVGQAGVVDTTGAGDCFTSYFAAMLVRVPDVRHVTEEDLSKLLDIANHAAAMSVEVMGATAGVPHLDQVRSRVQAARLEWPSWAAP